MLPAVAFLPGQALRPAPLPWSIESCSRHPMLRKSTTFCTSLARPGVIGARMCTGKGSKSSQGARAGAPEADEEWAAGTDGANQEDKAPSTNDKSNSSFWGGLVAQMGGASARVVESGRAFRVRVGEVAGPPGSKLTSSWTGLVNSTAVAVSGGGAASVRTLSAARSRVGPVLKYAANVTSLAAAASAGTLLNLTRGGGRNKRYAVKNQEEMEAYLRDGVSVHSLDIRGRSQPWRQSENGTLVSDALSVERPALRGDGRDTQLDHPVLRVISQRLREGSKPGQRTDNYKIALAIEGGGLRGSVTAGMASAIMHLGMADAFDMVLGSSAGSIIGTYLVARAQPVMTYQFFCNHLTTSREKLNGTSWLDLGRLVDLFTPGRPLSRPGGQAVMVLDYPMKTLMQELLPVDWKTFEENDKAGQSMKVVATGLFSEGPVVLGSEEGSFTDLASLCECVKASCMLPGVAGVQPPWLKGSSAFEPEKLRRGQRRWLDQELSATVWVKAREAFVQQLQRRRAARGGMLNQAVSRIKVADPVADNVDDAIDKGELRAALEGINVRVSEEELDVLFERGDLDQNGVIDIDEFKQMVFTIVAERSDPQRYIPEQAREWRVTHAADDEIQVEPMVDALVYEPIPYRSAIEYGATHVLVLRSFPDGRKLPKSLLGLFERLVAPKCLAPFPKVREHLLKEGHSIAYAEDVLRLNAAVVDIGDDTEEIEMDDARDVGRSIARMNLEWVQGNQDRRQGFTRGSKTLELPQSRDPYLLSIAPLDTDGEVSQLSLKRDVLLHGIMQGFARAYDLLAPDGPSGERIKTGNQVASEVYLPIHYDFLQQLAEQDRKKAARGAAFTKSGAKAGTQFYTALSAARLKMQRDGDWRAGSLVPDGWSEGLHFTFDEANDFSPEEVVVVRRSDATLRLAVVEAFSEGQIVLRVDDGSADGDARGGGRGQPFRVEYADKVGKICRSIVAIDPLNVVAPPAARATRASVFGQGILKGWGGDGKGDAKEGGEGPGGSAAGGREKGWAGWQGGKPEASEGGKVEEHVS